MLFSRCSSIRSLFISAIFSIFVAVTLSACTSNKVALPEKPPETQTKYVRKYIYKPDQNSIMDEFDQKPVTYLNWKIAKFLNSETDANSVGIASFTVTWVNGSPTEDGAARLAGALIGGGVGSYAVSTLRDSQVQRKDSLRCHLKGNYKQIDFEVDTTMACPKDTHFCFGSLNKPVDTSLPENRQSLAKFLDDCLNAATNKVRELKLAEAKS